MEHSPIKMDNNSNQVDKFIVIQPRSTTQIEQNVTASHDTSSDDDLLSRYLSSQEADSVDKKPPKKIPAEKMETDDTIDVTGMEQEMINTYLSIAEEFRGRKKGKGKAKTGRIQDDSNKVIPGNKKKTNQDNTVMSPVKSENEESDTPQPKVHFNASAEKKKGSVDNQKVIGTIVVQDGSKSAEKGIKSPVTSPASSEKNVIHVTPQRFKRPGTDRPHKCQICEESFALPGTLRVHMFKHAKVQGLSQRVACEVCNKEFADAVDLALHRKNMKHFSKSYKCENCTKAFVTKGHYLSHIERKACINPAERQKKAVKRHKCDFCNKIFALPGTLQIHMSKHKVKEKKGDIPGVMFTCTICKKKYENLDVFKRHEATHAKEAHPCKSCGKVFPCISGLQTHMVGKSCTAFLRRFRCDFCYSSIAQSDYLAHLKSCKGNTILIDMPDAQAVHRSADIVYAAATKTSPKAQNTKKPGQKRSVKSSEETAQDEAETENNKTEIEKKESVKCAVKKRRVMKAEQKPHTTSPVVKSEDAPTLKTAIDEKKENVTGKKGRGKKAEQKQSSPKVKSEDEPSFNELSIDLTETNEEEEDPTMTEEENKSKTTEEKEKTKTTGKKRNITKSGPKPKSGKRMQDKKKPDLTDMNNGETNEKTNEEQDKVKTASKKRNAKKKSEPKTKSSDEKSQNENKPDPTDVSKREVNETTIEEGEKKIMGKKRNTKKKNAPKAKTTGKTTQDENKPDPTEQKMEETNTKTKQDIESKANTTAIDKAEEKFEPWRKTFKCNICEAEFPHLMKYKIHRAMHATEDQVKCKLCDKEFPNNSTLTKHLDTCMNSALLYQCNVCGSAFASHSNLNKHYRIHEDERPYQCIVCKASFRWEHLLTKHMEDHPEEAESDAEEAENDVEIISPDKETSKLDLRNATFKKTPKSTPQSAKRGRTAKRDSSSEVVRKFEAYIPKTKNDTGKRKATSSPRPKEQAKKAKKKTTQVKKHIRSIYGMHFPPMFIKRHMRRHTREKPYKCVVCQRPFSDSTAFRRHQLTHSGKNKYKCHICSTTFTLKSTQIYHKQRHSGKTPYRCWFCRESFINKGNLNKHVRRKHV